MSYDDDEIDKERGMVIEEWRLGRGANMRTLVKQLPVKFKGSCYANRLPIGRKEVVDTCKYETLKRFYKEWYRPELMAVVAIGDFNQNEMINNRLNELRHQANPPFLFGYSGKWRFVRSKGVYFLAANG